MKTIDADAFREELNTYILPIIGNNLMGAADVYYRVCHLLDAVEDVSSKSWISVENKPLPHDEVIAANFEPGTYGYKECIIGYISEVKCTEPDWHSGKCYAENDYEILNNVTHYIRIPDSPEELKYD